MLAHHEKMRHCLNVILLEIVDSSFDLRYLNDLFLALIDKSKYLIFIVFLCFLSQVANVMHLSNRERASLADFLTSASFLPFKINIKSLNQYIHRRTFADHDTAFETYFFPTISLGVKASEPPAHTFRKTHVIITVIYSLFSCSQNH